MAKHAPALIVVILLRIITHLSPCHRPRTHTPPVRPHFKPRRSVAAPHQTRRMAGFSPAWPQVGVLLLGYLVHVFRTSRGAWPLDLSTYPDVPDGRTPAPLASAQFVRAVAGAISHRRCRLSFVLRHDLRRSGHGLSPNLRICSPQRRRTIPSRCSQPAILRYWACSSRRAVANGLSKRLTCCRLPSRTRSTWAGSCRFITFLRQCPT